MRSDEIFAFSNKLASRLLLPMSIVSIFLNWYIQNYCEGNNVFYLLTLLLPFIIIPIIVEIKIRQYNNRNNPI
jgi:hypothetical protein